MSGLSLNSGGGSTAASPRVLVLEIVVLAPPLFLAERLFTGVHPLKMLNIAVVFIRAYDTAEEAAGLAQKIHDRCHDLSHENGSLLPWSIPGNDLLVIFLPALLKLTLRLRSNQTARRVDLRLHFLGLERIHNLAVAVGLERDDG